MGILQRLKELIQRKHIEEESAAAEVIEYEKAKFLNPSGDWSKNE